AASTLYVVNPFVYGRLQYGQLFLLAAYAAMPLGLLALRRLIATPGLRSALGLAGAMTLIGILSPHALLMSVLLATTLLVTLALRPAMGIASGATAWMVSGLGNHLVVYKGMRDAGKWAVVIASVYSQLVGLAVGEGLDWLPRHVPAHWEPWVGGAAAGLLLAL